MVPLSDFIFLGEQVGMDFSVRRVLLYSNCLLRCTFAIFGAVAQFCPNKLHLSDYMPSQCRRKAAIGWEPWPSPSPWLEPS